MTLQFFLFGGFCFASAIFYWFFVPETSGLTLEDMDQVFGLDRTIFTSTGSGIEDDEEAQWSRKEREETQETR